MTPKPPEKLKVAFVVGAFPLISETFIINQVADLLERGVEVEIFSFEKGGREFISSRYDSHRMAERTHYLQPPASHFRRVFASIGPALFLLRKHPKALMRALNVRKYGKNALSLKFFFWLSPFIGKRFDIVHCHFGDVGARFVIIRELLGTHVPFVTAFYGCDVSMLPKREPRVYDRLKREGDKFLVMSNNMKQRVVAQGFPEDKVAVHPVSIDVDSYPFAERNLAPDRPVEIVSVGRFIEKKGFDDLLRALAIVKAKTAKKFRCSIVGGGELEDKLRKLATSLGLNDCLEFKGYMQIENIVRLFLEKHIFVQPSKTATDGDME